MHLTKVWTALACAGGALAADLPLLKLPYGTWRASKYDSVADVYTFSNVRFAAAPIGELRFAPPAPPVPVNEIQDGSYGHLCVQFNDDGSRRAGSEEDCLFLDLFVPGSVIDKGATDLSVLIWIYGGSYTSGGKDTAPALGLYDGTGLAYQAKGKTVVVVPNYRLGALGGWWAGKSTIEAGATSLGLQDQRAALQWIQDNIKLVGGNPDDVTIMGQSAGGGSIIHQITQKGGKRDPLFKKAIIISPGWQDIWDNDVMESTFQKFATNAGCTGGDFKCLREVPLSAIVEAQSKWSGIVLGPTPDGIFNEDHTAFDLENGNYWKDLESVVVTHVVNEGGLFVGGATELSDAAVHATLTGLYRNAEVVEAIEKRYPPVNSTNSPYTSGIERQATILSDSIFLNNYRRIAEAFAGRTFAASRTRGNAGHGDDIPYVFYNPTLEYNGVPLPEIIGDAANAQAWQAYLVSFAVTGNVNPLRNETETPHWPRFCTASRERLHTLNIADDGWKMIQDSQGTKSMAKFWSQILKQLVEAQAKN